MNAIATSPALFLSQEQSEAAAKQSASEKAAAEQTASERTAHYKWILHPVIDLLFCCGGLVWILFGLHYFVVGANSTNVFADSLLTISALATIFLGETHTVASLVRLYGEQRFKTGFSLHSVWVPLALSTLALVACSSKEIPPILAKIYLLIVSQHFTKQTYGIILLYCLKHNFKMGVWDKRLLACLMQATMVFAIVRQLTYKSWSGTEFLGQTIPFWGPLPEWIFVACAFWLVVLVVSLAIYLLRRLLATGEMFPFPALMLTITGVAIFVLGSGPTNTLWIYVPAFFHGSQYLTVTTSVYLKEQGAIENTPPEKISSLLLQEKCLRYFGFLVIAGIALFVGIPHILQQFGFSYITAVATIFTTIQFHHVIVDHAIWRMKDKGTRELLVS